MSEEINSLVKKLNQIVIPRSNKPIGRSYLVEVPLIDTGVGAKPTFERDNVLNPEGNSSVIFTGMEVYVNSLLIKSPTGRDVIDNTDATKLVLTLMYDDNEFIRQYPLTGLIPTINFGIQRHLDNRKIDLTKSFISVLDSGIPAGRSVIVNFFFLDPIKDAAKIKRLINKK